MVSTWKTKKENTTKFVDAGNYNRDERDRESLNSYLEWVDREGWRK
jgi:hypothetical protein